MMFLTKVLPFLLGVLTLVQASSMVLRNKDSFLTGFLAALKKENLTSLAKTYENIAGTNAGKPVIDLLKSGPLTLLAPENSAFDPDHPDIDPDVLRYSTLWGSIDDNICKILFSRWVLMSAQNPPERAHGRVLFTLMSLMSAGFGLMSSMSASVRAGSLMSAVPICIQIWSVLIHNI
ncbi:hypothetical protein FRC09_019191 [Ceratobasidium sp. 395]|nr:hypothetical protein FRC09_019191 [Ceratobasidium sp. 395]